MYAGAVLSVIGIVIGLLTLDKAEVRKTIVENDSTLVGAKLDQAVNAAYIGSIVGLIVVTVISVALWIVLAIFNGKGMSWARIVATIMGVLGVVFTLFGLTQDASAAQMLFSLLTPILAIAILVLLWKKESSQYYEACEVARARG